MATLKGGRWVKHSGHCSALDSMMADLIPKAPWIQKVTDLVHRSERLLHIPQKSIHMHSTG
jgi:hypothetical protein